MADEHDINPWLIALSVVLPTFMEVVDTSIASVALPHIAGSLSASTDEATWVLTSYLAANAVVLPASSWFSLRFGRKRFLLSCIVLFTIASFACGAATTMGMILISRAIQGAAGGALQPLSQSILLESFPPEKRGAAMAMFGLGVVVAPIVGPTLGGWLTDQYSWRWAFYINIPVGALAFFMISRFVFDPHYIREAKPGRLDSIGLGLLALGLGLMQIILDKGQEDDWFGAVWIRWGTLIMTVALVAFVIRQLTHRHPLVDLRVLENRNFALGCVLIALFGGAVYGIVTLLPLFYQTLMGYTAATAGIAVSPRGVGAVLIMPVIGALTARIDNRWFIATGFGMFGLMSLWFGHLNLGMSEWTLTWPIILSGVASGMVFVPLSTTSVATLTNQQMGNASGLYNLMRNVGGSVGISLVNTMIARHTQIRTSELSQNITPLNTRFESLLHGLQALAGSTAAGLSPQRALAMVQQMVDQQAAMLAYVDDFRWLALACFLCVPVVFLLRGARARKGATAAAH
ncbi:MAG TPA: DHA2 family efflux MFS transporter permease subunit [Bryobacteraceae bacterium]|nr:DHA2 family efflux MFS transporter permease subunit [Bryobacteraceae bacterium]